MLLSYRGFMALYYLLIGDEIALLLSFVCKEKRGYPNLLGGVTDRNRK